MWLVHPLSSVGEPLKASTLIWKVGAVLWLVDDNDDREVDECDEKDSVELGGDKGGSGMEAGSG